MFKENQQIVDRFRENIFHIRTIPYGKLFTQLQAVLFHDICNIFRYVLHNIRY